MATKTKRARSGQSSAAVAKLAARILRGGAYRERDVLILAASVVSQAPNRKRW